MARSRLAGGAPREMNTQGGRTTYRTSPGRTYPSWPGRPCPALHPRGRAAAAHLEARHDVGRAGLARL